MSNPSFQVTAIWDDDASVWVSESDIKGLHIEADTLDEFQNEVREHAAHLIVANHYQNRDLDRSSLRDLIPAIFFRTDGPDSKPI